MCGVFSSVMGLSHPSGGRIPPHPKGTWGRKQKGVGIQRDIGPEKEKENGQGQRNERKGERGGHLKNVSVVEKKHKAKTKR